MVSKIDMEQGGQSGDKHEASTAVKLDAEAKLNKSFRICIAMNLDG